MKPRNLYMKNLRKWIDVKIIKVITGVRRSGKSHLLMLVHDEIRKRGIPESRIISINFELIEFDSLRNHVSLNEHIKDIANKEKDKLYILIDEIQNCDKWERTIASLLASIDCDIYITGSNAGLLSGELATYLAGRYLEFHVYPLSFREFMQFNEADVNDSAQRESMFSEYIKFGGFPGLHVLPDNDESKKQYLKGIMDSVILRDVIQRNQIRDAEILQRILLFLMDNVGNIFSANKIVDYLKSIGSATSVDSVYSYIAALENAMIIHSAKRYDVRGKKVLKRMEKHFICDTGLRYASLGYRGNDISQLLENMVFMHLTPKGYEVRVGKKGDREVDFIAEKEDDRVYIQVSYLLASPEVVDREYKSLSMIKDSYPKLVLSMDRLPIGQRDGIRWMNLIEYLLQQ